MAHHPVLGRVALPCLVLALFVFPGSVRADFAPPTSAGGLLNDFTEFASDFSSWNTSMHNEPALLLASASQSDQGNMILLLFMLWMEEQNGAGSTSGNSASSGGTPALPGNLGMPGSIPTGLGNPIGDNIVPGNPSLPDSVPDNGGISPLPIIAGPPTGPEPVIGPSSGPVPEFNPVPEPASLALLGTGALGFVLFGRRSGRERARRANGKEVSL